MKKWPSQSEDKDHDLQNQCCCCVLLYGCETWDKLDRWHKLDVFQHKCLMKIMKVYWLMKVSTAEEIRERSHMKTIGEQVRARKWLGRVLRMSSTNIPTWALKGKC